MDWIWFILLIIAGVFGVFIAITTVNAEFEERRVFQERANRQKKPAIEREEKNEEKKVNMNPTNRSTNSEVGSLRNELNKIKESQAKMDLESAESVSKSLKIVLAVLFASLTFIVACWWNANSVYNFVVNPEITSHYTDEYGYTIDDGVLAMDSAAMTSLRDSYQKKASFWMFAGVINIIALIILGYLVSRYNYKVQLAEGKLYSLRADSRMR